MPVSATMKDVTPTEHATHDERSSPTSAIPPSKESDIEGDSKSRHIVIGKTKPTGNVNVDTGVQHNHIDAAPPLPTTKTQPTKAAPGVECLAEGQPPIEDSATFHASQPGNNSEVETSTLSNNSKSLQNRLERLEREIELIKKNSQVQSAPAQGDRGDDDNQTESGEDATSKDNDNKHIPTILVPEIRKTSWAKFNKTEITHSIDVIYGEKPDNPPVIDHNTTGTTVGVPADHFLGPGIRPSRIIIQSNILQAEIASLTDLDMDGVTKEIIPPFRPFVFLESKIREHTETIRIRFDALRKAARARQNRRTPDSDVPHLPTRQDAQEVPLFPAQTDQQPVPPRPATDQHNPLHVGCLMVGFDIDQSNALAKLDGCKGEGWEKAFSAFRPNNPDVDYEERYKLMKCYILVEEWKLLVELLDTVLSDIMKVRHSVEQETLQSVAFEDLGLVFEPGQMVLNTRIDDKYQQLSRIYSCTGGRRINRSRTEDGTDVKTGQPIPKFSPFKINCYHVEFDGNRYGPALESYEINQFYGLAQVSTLKVRPAWFEKPPVPTVREDCAADTARNIDEAEHSKPRTIESSTLDMWSILLQRGKLFAMLCDPQKVAHKQYNGLSLDVPPEEVSSNVIVDLKMASLVPPQERPPGKWITDLTEFEFEDLQQDERELGVPCIGTNTTNICSRVNCQICGSNLILDDRQLVEAKCRRVMEEMRLISDHEEDDNNKMSDDEYRLLPCRVFGFVLRTRKWAQLNIWNISEIKHEEDNFSKLVLPKGYASIVQALVETHTTRGKGDNPMHEVDLVKGKGKGLIILLHGAPGVGKTSTAECVADHTRRPLYPITCGDLGDTAEAVERNLERCFQLAHKWGCVLLLDEADVFLAERNKTDLKRNALVSVFLRVLEYYAGILFLTTNRVGIFDEAFKSRIHISLGYPPLDSGQTRKIWRMNLKRTAAAKGLNIKVDDEKIIDFAAEHFEKSRQSTPPLGAWNGRQIRNAFQTAIALARWEVSRSANPDATPTLTDSHFQQVADTSRDFDIYLKDIYRFTDSQRAKDKGLRADDRNLPTQHIHAPTSSGLKQPPEQQTKTWE